MKTTSSNERTEPINGMQMYYEIRGEGEPLVLLHGGTGGRRRLGTHLQRSAQGLPAGCTGSAGPRTIN